MVEKAEKVAKKEKSAERTKFLERKAKALAFEKDNYSKIFFFRAERGFFIAGNHSAVILFNMIKPELDLKISIRKDNGFESRFDQVVTIKNLGYYKTRLLESNHLKPGYDETDDRVVFALKKPLTKKAYEVLKNSERTKREILVNSVSSVTVMPDLHEKFRELVRETYLRVNKMSDRVARETVGYAMMEHANAAFRQFLIGCHKEDKLDAALVNVEELLGEILRDLVVMEAISAVHVTECHKISRLAVMIRTQIQVERKARASDG